MTEINSPKKQKLLLNSDPSPAVDEEERWYFSIIATYITPDEYPLLVPRKMHMNEEKMMTHRCAVITMRFLTQNALN